MLFMPLIEDRQIPLKPGTGPQTGLDLELRLFHRYGIDIKEAHNRDEVLPSQRVGATDEAD
jgi:hypothetical protein